MEFYVGAYDTYFLLGDPNSQPLWNWPVWSEFVLSLDPVIRAARGVASVRSDQYLLGQKGTLKKFGKINWNERGHQTWTHGSPTTKLESAGWGFLGVEVWAPTWTVCSREDCAPDVFLSVTNEAFGRGYNQPLAFNPVVVFAVRAALSESVSDDVRNVVLCLNGFCRSKLSGYKRRPWGFASGEGAFTDAIQHLRLGLFKAGPMHNSDPGVHLLREEWDPIPTE